jgi:hypothetical protein
MSLKSDIPIRLEKTKILRPLCRENIFATHVTKKEDIGVMGANNGKLLTTLQFAVIFPKVTRVNARSVKRKIQERQKNPSKSISGNIGVNKHVLIVESLIHFSSNLIMEKTVETRQHSSEPPINALEGC